MDRTAAYNCRAIAFLQTNQGDKASGLLRKSLKRALAEVLHHGAGPAMCEEDIVKMTTGPCDVAAIRQESVAWTVETVPIPDLPAHDESGSIFAFFNRCFLFVQADNHTQVPAPLTKSELAGALLFNMGQTTLLSCKDSSRLTVALRYFELADRILRDQLDVAGASDVSRCILLAVTNNIGLIYSNLANYEETVYCREVLCELLAPISMAHEDGEEDSTEHSTMDEDEYLFFFMSMFCSQGMKMMTAPCA